MTNGNDILEFMEKNYADLTEDFINQFQKEWVNFIFDRFSKRVIEVDGRDYYLD